MGRTPAAHSASGAIADAMQSFCKRGSSLVESHAAKYAQGYLALRSLVRDRTDTDDPQQLLSAAYAVYGWMPTILKGTGDLQALSRFISTVRQFPPTASVKATRDLLS